jgi:hypothetical protein
MKLAVSALFAFVLLAGGSGCHCFYRSPLFGGGCMDECCMDECCVDDCGDCGGGCGACGCNVGPFGGCGGMGCSRRLHVFNWSRCRDCCDCCANWTGEGFVSQTGGFPGHEYSEAPAEYDLPPSNNNAPRTYEEPATEGPSARLTPGSTRITTRHAAPLLEQEVEESFAGRPRPMPSGPRRAKRINSTQTK